MQLKSVPAVLFTLVLVTVVMFNYSLPKSNKAEQREYGIKKFVEESVCHLQQTSDGECERLNVYEFEETLKFPMQLVAGVPGSGNDWILWLASISGYTLPRKLMHAQCAWPYVMAEWIEQNSTKCLFVKTHEPWFRRNDPSIYSTRATLLLRHPYDAAFSEYKRKLVINTTHEKGEWKSSNTGVSVEHFIDVRTNITVPEFALFLETFTSMWFNHSSFWLASYNKPLHVMLYNDVIVNTKSEIESMQQFFGYHFNGVNIRRHCCVMANPFNPSLKRKPSKVDLFKEVIYQNEIDMRYNMEKAVTAVQHLLAKRQPGSNYKLKRG